MSERRIDSGHLHELLDRASVFRCMIEDHLAKFPGLRTQYPELRSLAERASDVLGEFYQLAGHEMDKAEIEEARMENDE